MIRSAAGLEADSKGFRMPPFRSPHHTSSAAALVGGGTVPRPGEVSLAHRGVLLLDEFPEFGRSAIDALREPIEDGVVTISRAAGTVSMPARSIVVATMNPDRGVGSGRGGSRDGLDRIGGPMLDRFDLQVEVEPPSLAGFLAPRRPTVDLTAIRRRIEAARGRAGKRGGTLNAALVGTALDRATELDSPDLHHLIRSIQELGLSVRALDRVRRIARTIADLDSEDRVGRAHVDEALSFRLFGRRSRTG